MKVKNVLKSKKGEGYIDTAVIVIVVVMVLALILSVMPAVITKFQLDSYASEMAREAEIAGRIGTATTSRAKVLTERTGIKPKITWSKTGKIQLNEEFTVTLTYKVRIGFGDFGSFPVTLVSKATGKSEVYWK